MKAIHFKGNYSAVMCLSSCKPKDFIQSYYLQGYQTPIPLVASNLTIGIMNSTLILTEDFVTCKFSRVQAYSDTQVPGYGNITIPQYYLLTAYGPIDNQGKL